MGSLSQVAEALYQVRGVLESGVKDSAQRQCLKLAEHALASYLRDAACEPGETSTDADHLKLNLMRAKREGPHLVLEREVDVIESYIGEAMLADNAIAEWKMVSRFATFCNRVILAGDMPDPKSGRPMPGLIADDPVFPVAPWFKKRLERGGSYPTDLKGWAYLFAEWSKDAARATTPGADPFDIFQIPLPSDDG